MFGQNIDDYFFKNSVNFIAILHKMVNLLFSANNELSWIMKLKTMNPFSLAWD